MRNSVIDSTELDKALGHPRGDPLHSGSPEELVHDVIDEVVWGDQAIGRSIAGTEESVGGIDRETMVDFWQRITSRAGWSSPPGATCATTRS